MAKPIGQTFSINDLEVEGIFLTKIRLYFKSKDTNKGIALQLRECDNGEPTRRIVPFSKVQKEAADINVSSDASAYTDFSFDSPVFVKSGEVYAFVLIPDNGSPEYEIWTAKLGEKDISTDAAKPIQKNNEIGTLFISSNDISWTAVQEEDIKFEIFRAQFEGSGTIIVREPNIEYLLVKNPSATFEGAEFVVAGNGDIKAAKISFSSATGTWSNGELVYQSNGSANTATGILYFSNSTMVKVQNTTGEFIVSNTITGATSSAYATITSVSQNVITYGTNSTPNNTILVPDTSLFSNGSTNNLIYIIHSNTAATPYGFVANVVSINSAASTLTLARSFNFSTNAGTIGQVKGGSMPTALRIRLNNVDNNRVDATSGDKLLFGSASSANSTQNFNDTIGNRLIGLRTGIHYVLKKVIDLPYDAISADFKPIVPSKTSFDLAFKGFKADNSFTADATYIDITPGQTFEFNDYSRIMQSRSNSFDLAVGRQGNSSFMMEVSLATDDPKISPYFAKESMDLIAIRNITANSASLRGYWLTLANSSNTFTYNEGVELDSNTSIYGYAIHNSSDTALALYGTTADIILKANVSITANTGAFTNGELVYQSVASVNTATGVVLASNSTVVQLVNTFGTFVTTANIVGATSTSSANISSIAQGESITGQTSGTTANIVSIQEFNENKGNGIKVSRYITRPVKLADGQDAEDHQVYITAYRPPGTDFYVYGRFLSAIDTQSINKKAWSRLNRISSNTFYSSATDSSNFIELEYKVPVSNNIIANTAGSSISGNTITTPSVAGFTANTYIYIYDGDKAALNVRKLTSIPNGTQLQLDSTTSFAFSSNVWIGTLDNVESKDSAFVFVNPDPAVANSLTYSTNNDKIYSTYKTFAIKIVPVTENMYVVPRADDMRALCLQT